MAKKDSVLDIIKVGMRFFQNFDKMKKSAIDIKEIAGKLVGTTKKKEELDDDLLGITKDKK
jgi:hypothetical protein